MADEASTMGQVVKERAALACRHDEDGIAQIDVIVETLTAHGFDVRGPDCEESQRLKVMGLRDATCEITVEDSGCHSAEMLPVSSRARHAEAPLYGDDLPPLLLSWARAFPGTAEQVGAARRFTADLLMGLPLLDDALIVVSELITNAVLHTESGKPGGLVTVQVSRWRHGVRIAVTDQGSRGTPVICDPAAAGGLTGNGNGLWMVSCLASHLDWHDDASGRTVHAILGKLPPRHHPAPAPGGLTPP